MIQSARGTARQLLAMSWLRYGAGYPLPGCCADQGAGLRGYLSLECLAYGPAAAVIILAAMLRMLADLPDRCCWPTVGQGDDQDGQEAASTGMAAVLGWPVANYLRYT